MIQYHFTCTLLSDVIVSSASATEGFHPSLDYIPGAKFWGIVASQLYKKQTPDENLNLFHNGKVCFGDAHLEINGMRSHKIPLSWFTNKGSKTQDVYVHHFTDYPSLIESGVQPEQLSGDYFNEEGEHIKPAQDFAIKSAYDTQLRRSKDEKMYGYYALPVGSKWRFIVSSDSKELLEQVKKELEGKKRIGRSRSAQYGLADIRLEKPTMQKHEEQEKHKAQELAKPDKQEMLLADTYYLYADSPVMLPLEVPLREAFEGGDIDFKKSKIRTRIYQSWNTHRNTRDADRQIIEKGSVIVVQVTRDIAIEKLLHRLLERRAEGFGELLINPPFLTNIRDGHFLGLNLTEGEKSTSVIAPTYPNMGEKNENLITLLQKRKDAHNEVQDIGVAVNKFIVDKGNFFRLVTASQWGTVRAFAKLNSNLKALDFELFNEGQKSTRKGYLISKIAEEKWKAGRDFIKEIVNNEGTYPEPRHLFLEKLAAEMAKRKHEKENQAI